MLVAASGPPILIRVDSARGGGRMPGLASLSELARLATAEEEDASAAVAAALRIVIGELGGRGASLVYGFEDDFRSFDEGAPLELRRTALWIVNRELTSSRAPLAFRAKYGRVSDFSGLAARRQHDYVAAILPSFTTGNMVVVAGPWVAGHARRRRDFLDAATPLLSLLLLRRLKISHAEASQAQLETLFSIGRVISEAEALPLMLTRIASSVVSLAGCDHAVIDIFAADGSVRLRCINQHLDVVSAYTDRWTRAAQRPDPIRNMVAATRQPMVFEDAQNDERLPERGRAFFTSALIRSTAVFPMAVKDEVVGVISFGSTHPTRFDGRQREIIEGVAAQIATAVHGVQLYERRREAEAALRRSQELLTATIESTADGILAVDGSGAVTYANRRFAEMWRIPESLMASATREELLAFVFDQLANPEEWVARINELYASSDEDLSILGFKDGRVFERYSRPLLQGDQPAGRVWSFRDVTRRHQTEQLLIDQARRDSLTKLLNHAAIEDRLRECARNAASVGVVVVDVDGMKAVNDMYGHVAGDAVLSAVAASLEEDGGAQAGRYGGDEFVVVLPGMTRPEAQRYCHAVNERLSRARVTDSASACPIPVSVSMGLTVWPAEVRSVDDAIRVADEAMYAEKRERLAGADSSGVRQALADERATRMIGEIVPVLTSSARFGEKLRLVAGRLSDGAGYAAVRFYFEPAGDGSPGHAAITRFSEVDHPQDGTISPEVTATVRRTKRPLFIEDLAADARLPERQRELATKADLGPGLCVPLLSGQAVAGFLSVASRRGSRLDARDARFLAAVGEQVMAIARMEALVDDLEGAASRLQDARADTVVMLAAAAEAHDMTTGNHLARVRTLSELLAAELGYGAEATATIGLAAILHDIGKIRVPESILLCPARLNGEEWSVMKRHTEWGAAFLRQRPGFELAAVIAQHHHERWDGGGYPAGLAGEAIPDEAAIVTVADSLDAITNDRPYRAGQSLRWALAEIRRCAGTQFSPTVVDALVRLYQRGNLGFIDAGPAELTDAA
jgi:diguanylate cyclase (GGDEF)-like protein